MSEPSEPRKATSEIAESIYKTIGSHSNWFAIREAIKQALDYERSEVERLKKILQEKGVFNP